MAATQVDFPRTRRSALAVAEALFSSEEGPPPAARLAWLTAEVADLLRFAGARARTLFQLCLGLVSWLAPLWIGKLPPLRRLSLPDRVRALYRMEDNPSFAPLILACKAMLCMIYYEEEGAARSVAAYDPCEPPRRRLPIVDPPAIPPPPRPEEAPQLIVCSRRSGGAL